MFFFANPILIAAAVIPAIVLLAYVYRADRLEPEPPGLLWSLVWQASSQRRLPCSRSGSV